MLKLSFLASFFFLLHPSFSFPQVKANFTGRVPHSLHPQAQAGDHPSFMGESHDRFYSESMLIKSFSPKPLTLLWTLPKEEGYSGPAVKHGKVYLFHREGNSEIIEARNISNGQPIWHHAYPCDYVDAYGYGGGPRSTPLVLEEYVITHGVKNMLHCLNPKTGKVIWKKDLQIKYTIPPSFFGASSSPIYHQGKVILMIGAKSGATVIALDPKTGKEIWRGAKGGASYATPIIQKVHGQSKLLVFTGGKSDPPTGGLFLLDPNTGKTHDFYPWRSLTVNSVNAACPVFFDQRVFITASYDTGGILLEIDKKFKFKEKWSTMELGAHWDTPLYKDGYIYGIDGRHPYNARVVCLEASTGKLMWSAKPQWSDPKTGGKRGIMRGSMLHADGDVLILSERGELLWAAMDSSGFKIIDQQNLFTAWETWTVPVISQGLLFVSQNSRDNAAGTNPRFLVFDMRKKAN